MDHRAAVNLTSSEVPHLTGIRGIACLGVFMVHAVAGVFPQAPEWVSAITAIGRHGVVVFFVLSAYTIALSLKGKPFHPWAYAAKRYFRIAPAYYAVLLIVLFLAIQMPPARAFATPYDWQSFLLHLSFLNFLKLGHVANGLDVEWTLGVELVAYVFLPLAIWASRSRVGIAAMIAAVLFGLLIPDLFGPWGSLALQKWKWSLAPFALCFVAGVMAITYSDIISRYIGNRANLLVLIGIAMVILFDPPDDRRIDVPYYTVVSLAFIIGGAGSWGTRIFSNALALTAGKYSYSLYLVHVPIIILTSDYFDEWWHMLAAVVASALASFALYHLAEEPGRRLGRALSALR